MNRFHTTSLAAALAFAMSATVGVAQESGQGGQGGEGGQGEAEHTTFDARGDLSKGDDLDFDTVGPAVDQWGVYDAWDADRDGNITRDEFNRGVYTTYDLDNNQMIDPDEYSDLRRDGMFRRDWRAAQ